ncbi:MAG: 1-deoxy-D-xylulose-5-phosphate reductoisomerase [Planctomycetes bacterium]|nr:1-deoxy-D-xylulose-5-phosphate reductoisomerase [Planctomycetota bacterium]
MRSIALLGSTGSIGKSTLKVLEELPDFRVQSLAANGEWKTMREQVVRWKPARVVMADPAAAKELAAVVPAGVEVRSGADAIRDLASDPEADTVVAAITGAAGLPASVAAVSAGKRLCLANKEAMVMAGPLLTAGAEETGATILPIDSEHSAVFQAMRAGNMDEIRRVILTASGGPFREWTKEQIDAATPEQALKHPTWQMGAKITIDSATMMNKALEIIEARWLFSLDVEKIAVVIHPQSIVHSMVEFHDASTIAQLGYPDMCVPIRYALTFPRRAPTAFGFLDLVKAQRLDFFPTDPARFPALTHGFEAARRGGTSGAALNGANEAAVALFLEKKIRFPQIAALSGRALAEHPFNPTPALGDLFAIDAWARAFVARESSK